MGCNHYGSPRKSKTNATGASCNNVSGDNSDKISRRSRYKKSNCPFKVKARCRSTGAQKKWIVDSVSPEEHNHPFPHSVYYYSENRQLDDDQKKTAVALVESSASNKVIMQYMKEETGAHLHTKDVSNIRQKALTGDPNKAMFNMITGLQELGYHTHYLSVHDPKNNTDALHCIFFAHPTAVSKARRFNETISMDATYKTNSNRLPFVNVVGVLNNGFPSLKTFFIAGGWIIDESGESYNWIIRKLRDVVWPLGINNYPQVIVSDDQRALTTALNSYFPRSYKLLCQAHIKRNLRTKLLKYSVYGTNLRTCLTFLRIFNFQFAYSHFPNCVL